MAYEWLPAGLRALRGIEPYEVNQVLESKTRRPMPATGPDGHWVLTVWGRTAGGRALIVVVRQLTQWQWQILGALDMTEQQLAEFEEWEAGR